MCDCTTAAQALRTMQSALRKGRVWCGCVNGCWYGCWWALEYAQLAATNGVFHGTAPDVGCSLLRRFRNSSGPVWRPDRCLFSICFFFNYLFTASQCVFSNWKGRLAQNEQQDVPSSFCLNSPDRQQH